MLQKQATNLIPWDQTCQHNLSCQLFIEIYFLNHHQKSPHTLEGDGTLLFGLNPEPETLNLSINFRFGNDGKFVPVAAVIRLFNLDNLPVRAKNDAVEDKHRKRGFIPEIVVGIRRRDD